jgi:hypothetical protein
MPKNPPRRSTRRKSVPHRAVPNQILIEQNVNSQSTYTAAPSLREPNITISQESRNDENTAPIVPTSGSRRVAEKRITPTSEEASEEPLTRKRHRSNANDMKLSAALSQPTAAHVQVFCCRLCFPISSISILVRTNIT